MATEGGEISRKERQEAAAWFTRMNSGETTPAEFDEFRTWFSRSDENATEYQRLERMWAQFDNLPQVSRIPSPSKDRSARAVSRRTLLVGVSATAAAAVAAGWVGNFQDYLISDEFTSIAEVRETRLPDGSGVTLDANSAIAIDFSDDRRHVLLQRGRAFFDVATDSRRPFRVMATGGNVEALGTQFVVNISGDEVTTSVQESAVSVTAPSGQEVRLMLGQMVSYSRVEMSRVKMADGEVETAWRHGQLIFSDKPLKSVVADVNRYRHGRLQIVGSGLENLRVSGVFDIKNPDGILEAIIRTLPVRAVEVTPLLVVLIPQDVFRKTSWLG